MESKEKVVVKIVTDTSELDEACAKAERLKNCLQEAMELAHSIASLDLDLRINAVIDFYRGQNSVYHKTKIFELNRLDTYCIFSRQ